MTDAFLVQKKEHVARRKMIESLSSIYRDIATSLIPPTDYDPGRLMFLLLRFFNAKGADTSGFLLDADAENGMLWISMVRANQLEHLYYMKAMHQTLDDNVRNKICDEISAGLIDHPRSMQMMYWLIDMIPVPRQEEQDDHAAMTAYVDKVYDIIIKCSKTNMDDVGMIDIEEGTTITIETLSSLAHFQNTAQFILISILGQQETENQ